MNLTETQRRAYLDALGVDLWVPRDGVDDEEPCGGAATDSGGLDWEPLRERVAACTRCELHQSRTQTVFGVGNRDASWLFIGEAPGAEEDRRGEPFVGRAGKLLDEMLRAVGQSRKTAFIANVLKCRPPNNRDPKPDEAAACRDYLDRQIELIRPDIVIAVGRIAAHNLLGTETPVGRLRGKRHMLGDVPLVVTYHPAYLLRSPSQKRKVWDDLCLARDIVRERAS
ncbi:MAG: uracil-DNA glycosylase [Woeseiaceae bacterium]|nr:uracil-DNA glycosylase [Woeseiaceae bacterium]